MTGWTFSPGRFCLYIDSRRGLASQLGAGIHVSDQPLALPRWWVKVVAGERNWPIIASTDSSQTVTTVWVNGDRDDSACYDEAQHRVAALGRVHPETASLAAVMFQISEV